MSKFVLSTIFQAKSVIITIVVTKLVLSINCVPQKVLVLIASLKFYSQPFQAELCLSSLNVYAWMFQLSQLVTMKSMIIVVTTPYAWTPSLARAPTATVCLVTALSTTQSQNVQVLYPPVRTDVTVRKFLEIVYVARACNQLVTCVTLSTGYRRERHKQSR